LKAKRSPIVAISIGARLVADGHGRKLKLA
jgi:hypothetical protein